MNKPFSRLDAKLHSSKAFCKDYTSDDKESEIEQNRGAKSV